MTSPTDIITYIDVPLAVIGVLLIILVVLRTFFFSLHVRLQLKKNMNVVGLDKNPFWSTLFLPASAVTSRRGKNVMLQEGRYFEKILYYSIDVDVPGRSGQSELSYPAASHPAQNPCAVQENAWWCGEAFKAERRKLDGPSLYSQTGAYG
jgi:hypothetical protein